MHIIIDEIENDTKEIKKLLAQKSKAMVIVLQRGVDVYETIFSRELHTRFDRRHIQKTLNQAKRLHSHLRSQNFHNSTYRILLDNIERSSPFLLKPH